MNIIACVVLVALASSREANELLEAAEDEAAALGETLRREDIAARVASAFSVAHDGRSDYLMGSWAERLTEVRFSEGGVDDEVLPYIPVGATEAELKDAPAAKGMAVLHRKQRFAALQVDVLENQLVVLSGMESVEERKARLRAGLGIENEYASALACRPVNGTALFMLAYRRPVADSPHLHEIAFFDRPLWLAFAEYMQRARATADVFGGTSPWTMRIHWNVLPRDQREPWVASRAYLQTVASPTLLAPSENMA